MCFAASQKHYTILLIDTVTRMAKRVPNTDRKPVDEWEISKQLLNKDDHMSFNTRKPVFGVCDQVDSTGLRIHGN